jgi:hypothetical protein
MGKLRAWYDVVGLRENIRAAVERAARVYFAGKEEIP